MADNDFFPTLRNIEPDSAFVQALDRFIAKAQPFTPWEMFGRVPSAPHGKSRLRRWIDFYRFVIKGEGYGAALVESPAYNDLVRWLMRTVSPQAYLLFRLLCRNELVGEDQLATIVGSQAVSEAVNSRILFRRSGHVLCTITFVPFGRHYYITQARRIDQDRSRYGVAPVNLTFQTYLQVRYLKPRVAALRPTRILEVGCGAGVITVEMASSGAARDGIDITRPCLTFAAANAMLRGDSGARFFESDLFSRVSDKYDLIMFSPWQPSEKFLDPILAFLEQAPDHLTGDGFIFLTIATQDRPHDVVLEAIARLLQRQGRQAERRVIMSWFDGEGHVQSLSFLWIAGKPGNDAKPIRTVWDSAYSVFVARVLSSQVRGLWRGSASRDGPGPHSSSGHPAESKPESFLDRGR